LDTLKQKLYDMENEYLDKIKNISEANSLKIKKLEKDVNNKDKELKYIKIILKRAVSEKDDLSRKIVHTEIEKDKLNRMILK